MDAILFWNRFEGRPLRSSEFYYPERPENLSSLKPLENWPKFNPRKVHKHAPNPRHVDDPVTVKRGLRE